MEDSFERYIKNTNAFSREEVLSVQKKSVCVTGCGGLGGHVIQTLARFGVLSLTLVDFDVFSVSNLNRQIFCTEQNLGQNKAEAAKAGVAVINSRVSVTACTEKLTEKNAESVLSGHDLVIDCLDNLSTRFIIDRFCRQLGIPYVHGAIAGFYGQVSVIYPGDETLAQIYKDNGGPGAEQTLGSPSFTPQAVAAIQCAEALKVLTGRGGSLRNKLLYIDLLSGSYETISLSAGDLRQHP